MNVHLSMYRNCQAERELLPPGHRKVLPECGMLSLKYQKDVVAFKSAFCLTQEARLFVRTFCCGWPIPRLCKHLSVHETGAGGRKGNTEHCHTSRPLNRFAYANIYIGSGSLSTIFFWFSFGFSFASENISGLDFWKLIYEGLGADYSKTRVNTASWGGWRSFLGESNYWQVIICYLNENFWIQPRVDQERNRRSDSPSPKRPYSLPDGFTSNGMSKMDLFHQIDLALTCVIRLYPDSNSSFAASYALMSPEEQYRHMLALMSRSLSPEEQQRHFLNLAQTMGNPLGLHSTNFAGDFSYLICIGHLG